MISIVTGTLNRKKYLPQLIENTVNSNEKLELVLVDGGSDDGTIEYIKKYNHKNIKLIEIGHRSSYPHYMNEGIKAAKYEWIAQWNDDVILLDKWEYVLEELEDNYDLYIFKWTSRIEEELYLNKKDEKWVQFDHCMNFGIYNKKVFREIGLYDNKFSYYHCDQDMTRRALSFGFKCRYSDLKVCEIETEKRAVTTNKDDKYLKKNIKLYKKRKLPKSIEMLND